MIAAVAYYAYREHQKKQDEQRRNGTLDNDNNIETISPQRPTTNTASSSSPSSWFASLPLEENSLKNWYFGVNEQRRPEDSAAPDNAMVVEEDEAATTTTPQFPIVRQPLESTTFRESVRREWIEAVFGTEFPSRGQNDKPVPPQSINAKHHSCIQSAWKGVGLSEIPHYTTYTVELPPLLQKTASHIQNHRPNDDTIHILAEEVKSTIHPPKLGVTLSRLTLGLYVRHVHPGSEAWCTGVRKNSILVSINHGTINLLAEPTKAALERIWLYEGFCLDSLADSRSNDTEASPSSLTIREPISMTFMLHGRKYDVLFLSNPPYGIDWAPCGDFCLVNKVSSQRANEAGILSSSIVASVSIENDPLIDDTATAKTSIHDLDHQHGAELLTRAAQSNGTVRIQLCFPPSAGRSGHWERQQDALTQNDNTRRNGVLQNGRNKIPNPPRPEIAMEVDGVQVRIHSLVTTTGKLLHRRHSRLAPVSANRLDDNMSLLASRVAYGESISPLMTSRSTLSRTSSRGHETEGSTSREDSSFLDRRKIRPCPPMEKALVDCWGPHHAMSFVCYHHRAAYDAQNPQLPIPENHNVFDYLQCPPTDINEPFDVVKTFLLFWISLLSGHGNPPRTAAQRLLDLAQQNVVHLAHPMEFLARAFGNDELKLSLEKLRNHRLTIRDAGNATLSKDKIENWKEHHPQSSPKGPIYQEQPNFSAAPSKSDTNKEGLGKDLKDNSSASKPAKRVFRLFRKIKKSRRKKNGEKEMSTQTKAVIDGDSDPECKPKVDIPASSATSEAVVTKQRQSSLSSRPIDGYLATLSLQDSIFSHCMDFLEELHSICEDIEKSLMQSFSQKFARWALQPWTPSKETALAQVTHSMRERLKACNQNASIMPMLNPVDSREALLSVDPHACFILPSAHFPLLLTFDCEQRIHDHMGHGLNQVSQCNPFAGRDVVYRTIVELVELRGSRPRSAKSHPRTFCVHGCVAGSVLMSEQSIATDRLSNRHVWDTGNTLVFESRSSWGPPKTLSLRLTETSLAIHAASQNARSSKGGSKALSSTSDSGFCWVDLEPVWEQKGTGASFDGNGVIVTAKVVSSETYDHFDQHGDLAEHDSLPSSSKSLEKLDIKLNVTTRVLETEPARKSLLYKHDDDVRQEMFAIEFIKSCDRILKSCGLDMKILTFASVPVGKRQGFIEWVCGSVPLSEICQPFAGSILAKKNKDGNSAALQSEKGIDSDATTMSSVAKAGMSKYESLRSIRQEDVADGFPEKPTPNNPIQDYLRSNAYDPDGPYKIKKEVMDTFVKSCAGYSVCTYLLGVGDRHLDNLLLHQSGYFFHCDYSFILGNDPKKYLPMRITQDMVDGMGGTDSDNFCRFLALACASFLTLRRPENVRHLLSLVRVMEGSGVSDLEETQTLENAIRGLLHRLRLDLNDEQATNFMEKLIKDSYTSKMWMAVDAIHSLAQRF